MNIYGVLVLFVFVLLDHVVKGVTIVSYAGTIIGFEEQWQSIPVKKFRGIPYAEAPVGDRRFSAPVEKARFHASFNATSFGSPCIQNDLFLMQSLTVEPLNKTISEDCLNLNIYVPAVGNSPKPVMVFFHGGGFTAGAGMLFDGTKMAAMGEVIIVTVNYRLGVLGFFTTGDGEAAGNYGLLDQQLSLKWVKWNIAAFGGDPNNVTIFGESAGSASVAWHLLVPSNRGLFKGAILQSGATLLAWAWPDPKVVKAYTNTIADKTRCMKRSSKEIVACLRRMPSTVFNSASHASGWPFLEHQTKTPGGPRVDGRFIKYDPTCRDNNTKMENLELFRSIDLLAGANKYEGSPFLGVVNQVYMALTQGKGNLYKMVPWEIYKDTFAEKMVEVQTEEDARNLFEKYKIGGTFGGRELLEFLGDGMFYDGIMKTVKRHAGVGRYKSGNTYFYNLLPKPSVAVGSLSYTYGVSSPYVDGAIHGDDLGYLFGRVFHQNDTELVAKNETDLSDAMVKYWTNFAKTGNPNKPATVPLHWPKFEPRQQEYIELDIDASGLALGTKSFFRQKYLERWTDVKPRGKTCCSQICAGCSVWSVTSSLLLAIGLVVSTINRIVE